MSQTWKLDPATICPNCLETTWQETYCPHCDFRGREETTDKLLPGTILNGHYFVGVVLGREGGFGVTYKGRNLENGDMVAIKEFLPSVLVGRSRGSQEVRPNDEKAAQYYKAGLTRFREEAMRLQSFNHPSIVRVLDYFEENNTGYFVMPFVHGMTLAEYAEYCGGKLDYDLTVKIMTPVMDALRYAHARNIIHRDISPENIYINERGQVILLDFGAARSPIPGAPLTKIVKEGFSPKEVILGEPQGNYTDVYSTAATIYAACTGQEPPGVAERGPSGVFPGPSTMGVKIAKPAEAALMRGMAIQPQQRFQSIADLQRGLNAKSTMSALTMQRTPPPAVAPSLAGDSWLSRHWIPVTALSTLAIVVLLTLFLALK